MKETVLLADEVSYSYSPKSYVCDRVSMRLQRGELVALLGPNGAGKSTFLSLVAGLRTPHLGSIEILGLNPSTVQARLHLGVTPQDSAFPKTVRVREVLNFVGAQYGTKIDDDLIQALALQSLLPRLVGGLSGGERRRVGLACALCAHPDLIVLDEPTAGLDLSSRRTFFDYLKSLAKESECTVLFSTHHLDEVEQLSERVVVLHKGRILQEGRVDEIQKQFGYRRIRFRSQGDVCIPEIWNFVRDGLNCEVMARDAESFVRWMVEARIDFMDLEVQMVSLEEIFIKMVEP